MNQRLIPHLSTSFTSTPAQYERLYERQTEVIWSRQAMVVFQSLLRCQSKNILGGLPNMRLLCHYSCAGRQFARFLTKPTRLVVCMSVCCGMQRAQVILKKAERISYPSRGSAVLIWEMAAFSRPARFIQAPHSTSLALAAVTLPVSPPKYIRPRDEGGLSLFYLKAFIW